MSLIINAPNDLYSVENHGNLKIFLSGSSTNWQSEFIQIFGDVKTISIYNSRKAQVVTDPMEVEKYLVWEYEHSVSADLSVFWVGKNIDMISLFDLGMNLDKKPIIIGIDPSFQYIRELTLKLRLAGYGLDIFETIQEMASEASAFIEKAFEHAERDEDDDDEDDEE
jgi:hypothetical protein